MELRIWEYGADNDKIESFLHSAALAHNIAPKSEEWFHWKFEQSPYGKAILACAFDGNIVAGCVALGQGIAVCNGITIKSALSYETFVHPNYQGKGLFKRLIVLAEDACKRENIDILYNFPNSNSLPGFKSMGWRHIPKYLEYKINIRKVFRCLANFGSLTKPFQPIEPSVLPLPTIHSDNQDIEPNFINSLWSREYIEWRFFKHPASQYIYIDDKEVFGIARVGYRGELKECQILHITHNDCTTYKHALRAFVKYINKVAQPDIISICCSKGSFLSYNTWAFIKVPTKANFTYKILTNKITTDNFVISSIDFHTY